MWAAAATAAKSLRSCPTLCDPIDSSPPGSSVSGILQARTLEWVAISFSNAWKYKVKVKSLSHVWLLATPWTAAYQAPLSMGFSRQEYWSGVPLPSVNACSLRQRFSGVKVHMITRGSCQQAVGMDLLLHFQWVLVITNWSCGKVGARKIQSILATQRRHELWTWVEQQVKSEFHMAPPPSPWLIHLTSVSLGSLSCKALSLQSCWEERSNYL